MNFKKFALSAFVLALVAFTNGIAQADDSPTFTTVGPGIIEWHAFEYAWLDAEDHKETFKQGIEQTTGQTVTSISVQFVDWEVLYSSPIYVGELSYYFTYELASPPGN